MERLKIKDINFDKLKHVPGSKILFNERTDLIRKLKNTQVELQQALESGDADSARLAQEIGTIKHRLDNCNETILVLWRQQNESKNNLS